MRCSATRRCFKISELSQNYRQKPLTCSRTVLVNCHSLLLVSETEVSTPSSFNLWCVVMKLRHTKSVLLVQMSRSILPPPFTQGIKLAFPWFPLENGFKDDDHETFEKTFQHGRQSSKQKQKLNHTHTHTGNAEETGAVQGMEKQLISMIDNRIYSCIK